MKPVIDALVELSRGELSKFIEASTYEQLARLTQYFRRATHLIAAIFMSRLLFLSSVVWTLFVLVKLSEAGWVLQDNPAIASWLLLGLLGVTTSGFAAIYLSMEKTWLRRLGLSDAIERIKKSQPTQSSSPTREEIQLLVQQSVQEAFESYEVKRKKATEQPKTEKYHLRSLGDSKEGKTVAY